MPAPASAPDEPSPPRAPPLRRGAGERLAARALTGPPGHLAGTLLELAAFWLRFAASGVSRVPAWFRGP